MLSPDVCYFRVLPFPLQGYCVFGSDAVDSEQLQRLRALGLSPHVGHSASHLDDLLHCSAASKAVVRSSAVPESNEEVQRAKELGIPV